MRKTHNSKHKLDSEYSSDNEEQNRFSSKNGHHRRKHKKHKCKEGEDCVSYKNGRDECSLRNEVIEIHDTSSEKGSQHEGDNYNNQSGVKLDSHKNRHHRKEERRKEKEEQKHKKRRKRSRSDSRSRDRQEDNIKSKLKKSKESTERCRRNASDSDSEYESQNDSRKRNFGEMSSCENRRDEQQKLGEARNRPDIDRKGNISTEFQGVENKKVRREAGERQENNDRQSRSNFRRRYMDEASGSRSNSNKRGNKGEECEWGGSGSHKGKTNKPSGEVQKPNFGLSGKLAEDTNTFNGVVIKYSEPPEARMPKRRWRLYPFKGEEALPPLYIHRQSAYLLGRDRKVVDMPIDHPSCSKQHAALQYRLVTYERADGSIGKQIRLYIIDLESANGTFINNKKIEAKKYVELFEKDVIKFGFSSREYVLLHEHSVDDNPDDT